MSDTPAGASYTPAARAFHWIIAFLIALMFITGTWMTDRGEAGVWDATTNMLYSTHKLIGFTLIWLILSRLVYRLLNHPPEHAPTLNVFARWVGGASHLGLYVLMFAVPTTGWIGVSLFPALNVFGLFDLPALAAPDKAQAEAVFEIHELLGNALFVLICVHIVGAFAHLIVWRDGVFQRMWSSRK